MLVSLMPGHCGDMHRCLTVWRNWDTWILHTIKKDARFWPMEDSIIYRDIGKIQKLYQLYEKILADTQVVCREKCADCCTLYRVRPFGCRSMMSQVYCGEKGYAQVPPLALTITNVFLQYIEHLDYQGFSGNLSDMLTFYLKNFKNYDKTQVFIKNMKIGALLVPPEHRSEVVPLIKQIAVLT